MCSGFIQLHRKFLEWEWYDDHNTKIVFLHLLLKANYKPKKWRGEEIKRGQFITSTNTLSSDLQLSVQQIRTCLSKLESTGEINKQSTNKLTKITICKYDSYQSFENDDNKQITNKQQSNNNQITIKQQQHNKEIKKERNNINNNIEDKSSIVKAQSWNFYLDNWNEAFKDSVISKINKMTTSRKQHLKQRLKDRESNQTPEEVYSIILNKIKASRFLNGDNNTGWRCDFDWILKPANWQKILEGNYDDKNSTKKDALEATKHRGYNPEKNGKYDF